MDPSERSGTAAWDALVIHPDDDVAVALRDIAAGETVEVRQQGTLHRVKVLDPIPLGHKFALRTLTSGAAIRKYGEFIGVATAEIAIGAHVHVQNMASRRAQASS
ncbi:MAG TPA: UxaA family hydrolase [Casimicrobiaceae bacterium]|jgi:altronate dehydratase small subunit